MPVADILPSMVSIDAVVNPAICVADSSANAVVASPAKLVVWMVLSCVVVRPAAWVVVMTPKSVVPKESMPAAFRTCSCAAVNTTLVYWTATSAICVVVNPRTELGESAASETAVRPASVVVEMNGTWAEDRPDNWVGVRRLRSVVDRNPTWVVVRAASCVALMAPASVVVMVEISVVPR